MKRVYDIAKPCTTSGVDISAVCIERATEKYPQFNFFVSSVTDRKILSIGTFDCIALVGTLWYVMYDLDKIFDNVRRMLKPSGVFAINQTFLLDQEYGNDVFEGLHGFLALLSKNRFFSMSKIISNRIFHEGKFVMDTAILLEVIHE